MESLRKVGWPTLRRFTQTLILRKSPFSWVIFFSFHTTLWKGLGYMLCGDSRDSRFVPWQVFFVFQYDDEKTRAEWQSSRGKGGRCSIFRTEKYFYHQKCTFSVLNYLMFSRADISHSGGEVLPYKRLMGMRRWMESHFHVWIDYTGVAFLMGLLKWGRTFSYFLG